ncbi:hypothetical protein ACHAXT_012679 [Thalassiosira profunda]
MVYIDASGNICAARPPSRNPIKRASVSARNSVLSFPRVAIALAAAAVLIAKSGLYEKYFGPLANGAIPAGKMAPEKHWAHMRKTTIFVRSMTESLVGKTKATTKEGKKSLAEVKSMQLLSGADFGGPDGHAAEEGAEFMSMEMIRVTRCSTTRSGVTAFYCGADVATDQDVAHGLNAKSWNFGTDSFREYLACRHAQGQRDGNHRRSVFRLGAGCKSDRAGMSHAWSIVAQSDGTYWWLQSYINKYSLSSWMKKADNTKQSGIAGQLTFDELLKKLDILDRLMSIKGWTSQANDDYLYLFNVDKEMEPAKRWNDSYRLSSFSWDEACEWPLPKGYLAKDQEQEAGQKDTLDDNESYAADECSDWSEEDYDFEDDFEEEWSEEDKLDFGSEEGDDGEVESFIEPDWDFLRGLHLGNTTADDDVFESE